jgi:hypothetical protein
MPVVAVSMQERYEQRIKDSWRYTLVTLTVHAGALVGGLRRGCFADQEDLHGPETEQL